MSPEIRTRFSPSPTGMIHLGNARAALYSALFAAKHQGTFILRIEDTDMTRSDERYVESLQEDLHWLLIDWQEGPGKQGAYGPYWQSQRQAIYLKYYAALEAKNCIYPCFCSDQELMLARKLRLSRGLAPRYAGTCAHLSSMEIEERLAAGKKPAWRFKIPAERIIQFVDTVKGPQQFRADDIGDFIVRRADGSAPFLFSNAIDDATMKVSHVIRGEDHLANTPRQILILETLGLNIPQYGHLSLIVGDDGAPLSKRHGSFSVSHLREQGYLPIAVINYLARLGHHCEAQTLLSFAELAPHFFIEKLSRSPARFDQSQLLYWQKMAVQTLDLEHLWRWLGKQVEDQVPSASRSLFAKAIQSNIAFPEEALMWAKIFFHTQVSFSEPESLVIREAGEQFFVEAELAVDQYAIELPAVINHLKTTLGLAGKKLFMPLRVALTGKTHGPELMHIAEILGQKKMKERLSQAFKLASG